MQYNHSAFFTQSSTRPAGLRLRLLADLLGEERPRDMLILLTILVFLLHVWLITVLMRSAENVTEAEPLVMEVSMVVIPAAKPTPAPAVKSVAEPSKSLPPPAKKPLVKKQIKPKPQPVMTKPAPAVQKTPDFTQFEPFEPFTPTPPVEQTSKASSSSKSTTTGTGSATSSSSNDSTFTEANYRANYAHNPKPTYPTIAKSRGWQGKVLLRVKVSAQGLSDAVTVEESSGREMLDESAIEAVKQWRFIPAKRGNTPVASSVIVPIVFTLRN